MKDPKIKLVIVCVAICSALLMIGVFGPARRETEVVMGLVKREPTPWPNSTPEQARYRKEETQALREQLENVTASQSYKDLIARQSRSEPMTSEDMSLLSIATDFRGRMMEEPPLAKSTKFPPEGPESEAMWQWWRKMKAVDPRFEYKRPISFFGMVVDQDGRPIDGASAVVGISAHRGEEELRLTTDNQGRFQVVNKLGKRISVGVGKRGYGRGERSIGSFEYAEFFSERFHEPDPNNPVVFVLPQLKP